MYEEFYKLTSSPFKLTPNPAFFYPSQIHRKVMAYLQYGVEQADGFILVTGNVGTGKTTIIQMLLAELEQNRDIIVSELSSTQLDEGNLLRMIASSFGIDEHDLSKAELLRRLEKFLRKKSSEHKRILLIVDEVQNLPAKSLEELRMLSNFQEQGKPLFQSFLVGQEQFKVMIGRPDMEQLRQRVIASYHLNPLDREETAQYIRFRLECAGWQDDPSFSEDAYSLIYEYSEGVPRRINILCERIMLHAAMEELHKVDRNVVLNVINELDNETVSKSVKAAITSTKPSKNNNTKVQEIYPSIHNDLEERVSFLEAKLTRLEGAIEKILASISSSN
jgi:general secretion pathway protein A